MTFEDGWSTSRVLCGEKTLRSRTVEERVSQVALMDSVSSACWLLAARPDECVWESDEEV